MSSLSVCLFLLLFGVVYIESANILAIFPSPFRARYIVAEPLLKKLVTGGHNLTVISQFPQKQKLPNFHDITIEDRRPKDIFQTNDTSKYLHTYIEFLRNMTFAVLQHEEVQALLNTPTTRFHVVIAEVMLTEALYAFAPHFRAQMIGISMQGTDMSIDRLVGNISPLSYIPLVTSNITILHMTFIERLHNLMQAALQTWQGDFAYLTDQQSIYREYFPHLSCSLPDISKNFSLVLLNQHFTLSIPRPYVPNMVEVGGMYVPEKPKPLPSDIAEFIAGAEFGVIYFALGAEPHVYKEEKLLILFDVFSKLQQRVLFKHDNPDEPGRPANVLIQPWFSQTDILAQPKVKLFITHGGFLSILEAIYFAKPIIGLTQTYEQNYNMMHAESLGIGINMQYVDLAEQNFEAALERMLSPDNNFTKAVELISKRYHDQPRTPMDTAIYWIEYIIRNEGAPFMRVAAMELNFWEYYSVDVLLFLNLLWMSSIYIVIILTKSSIYTTIELWKHILRSYRRWREHQLEMIEVQRQLDEQAQQQQRQRYHPHGARHRRR